MADFSLHNLESPLLKQAWWWTYCNRPVILMSSVRRNLMALNHTIYDTNPDNQNGSVTNLEMSHEVIEVFHGLCDIGHRLVKTSYWPY